MQSRTVNLAACLLIGSCSVALALNSRATLADPLKSFGSFSLNNPDMQNEIRRSTGTTLEGTGSLWFHLTGLGVLAGVRFEDTTALKHLVESLHVSGAGLPWNGYSGGDGIRVYFDNSKNTRSTSDAIWYFYRNHKAYCVPGLYHWTPELYKPPIMYLVRPASSQRFEALIRLFARQAKRHHASFRLIDFGGGT